ncbi:lipopolysaccharide biosynthesis protein, partial [Streptococcus pneumoniae]
MKNIKVNALASLLVNVLNIVFPLITNPYLTRILSKSNYGYFNTANTWASFVIPLAAFGIYNYGIRAISKVKDDKNKINYVFSKLFYISIITSVLTTSI